MKPLFKFLKAGDLHQKLRGPQSRTDNFKATMTTKISKIVNIAYREGVDAILQTGDWFDSPNPPLTLVTDFMKLWLNGLDIAENINQALSSQEKLIEVQECFVNFIKELNDIQNNALFINDVAAREKMLMDRITNMLNKLRENEVIVQSEIDKVKPDLLSKTRNVIPIHVVCGNHDLYGNNTSTLNRTMLGFLVNLGLINLLDRDIPTIFKKKDFTVAITGTHYHADIDKPGNERDYVIEEKMGDRHIHLIHAMLSEKSMGDIIRHTLIDNIAHTKADVTLAGHEHKGFGLVQKNDRYFLNGGSIPRLSSNDDHEPQVYIIEVYEDRIEFRKISLNAQPNSEVFDTSAKEIKLEKDVKFAEYREMIKATGDIEAINTFEIINAIAESKSIKDNVRDEAVLRVSQAMDILGKTLITKQNNKIKAIWGKNWECHENFYIELSEGLNTFIGESRNGKSSILRLLDKIYYNDPNGDSFIKKGQTHFEGGVLLQNGYSVTRKITPSLNQYIINHDSWEKAEILEGFGVNTPEKVEEILGTYKVQLDKKNSIKLNYLEQGNGWKLLNDTEPLKAKTVGLLFGVHFIDYTINNAKNDYDKANKSSRDLQEEITKLEDKVKEFDYLDQLEKNIIELESLLKEAEEIEKSINDLTKLNLEYMQICNDYQETCNILNEIDGVEDIEIIVDRYELELSRLKELTSLLNQYINNNTELQKCNSIINETCNFDSIDTLVDEIELTIKSLDQLTLLSTQYETVKSDISKTNEIIEYADTLLQAENIIADMETELKSVSDLIPLHNEYKQRIIRINNCNMIIGYEKDIKLAEQHVEEGLQSTEETKSILPLIMPYNNCLSELSDIDSILKQASTINEIESMVIELETVIENYKTLINFREDYIKTINNINTMDKTLDSKEQALQEYITKYEELLKELGTCPVCRSEINDDVLTHVITELKNQ